MRAMTRLTAGIVALAVAGAAAAAAQGMHIRINPKVHVVVPHIHISAAMRGGNRPGPDSAAVGAFLTAMGRTDPIVCEMAVDQLGNNWGSWGGGATAGLRDRTETDLTQRSLFGGSVSDPRAVR